MTRGETSEDGGTGIEFVAPKRDLDRCEFFCYLFDTIRSSRNRPWQHTYQSCHMSR